MVSAIATCRATLLGMATGIRSMTPLATISWAASSDRLPLPAGGATTLVAKPRVTTVLLLAAASELVVDKLPFVPPRTLPGPLLGRLVLGALSGALAFAVEDESPAFGALVGGTSAVWGSYAGLAVRTQLTDAGTPAALAAVVGDILAIALSVQAVLLPPGTVA